MNNIDQYGEYVKQRWKSADNDTLDSRDKFIMCTGLPGEVGEVLELLKKEVRDGKLNREHLLLELGDVAFYWARIVTAYGFSPSEVLAANIAKLQRPKKM